VIHASTACVGTRDLWETLDAYRAAGLTAVELGATRIDDVSDLAQRLRDTGLDFAVHNYFPPPREPFVLNLASPDDGIRRRSLELARNAIDLCADIDAPFYSVHAGFVLDPVGRDGDGFAFADPEPGAADVALDRYADAYAQLSRHGGERGVAVLVENNVCTPSLRGKLLLQTTDEFAELRRRVPETAILVDTGHLNVSARTFGFDPTEFVEALGPAIGGWHLHANDGSADTHDPAAPGWWAIEMLGTAPVVVEARFETVEELADYVAWLAVVAG
jgi:sugar phosphate isomerase/epimerase